MRDDVRRPSAATLLLGVFAEVFVFLPVILVAAPIAKLDERYGWTAGGRRARAWRAFREGQVVPIERGATLSRAIVEGMLESAGPLVRVPFVDVDAVAWSVWAQDGSFVEWVDGQAAPLVLIDDQSGVRVELDHLRDLSWTLGQRRIIHEIPDEWRRKARRDPDSWEVSWIANGTRLRASGRISRTLPDAAFRSSIVSYSLGPDAEGIPVLFGRASRS